MLLKPVNFDYKELPGFSKRLLSDHFKLYRGYVDRFNEISVLLEKLPKKVDRFELQRLVLEDGFLRNAIALHELYFEQLTPGGKGSPEDIFGKETDGLLDMVSSVGMGSAGWSILAIDLWHGKEFVLSMKEHGQGYVTGAWPILVLDCYDHAFMRQYGLDKSGYIGAFFGNVNWDVVRARNDEANSMIEYVSSPGGIPAR